MVTDLLGLWREAESALASGDGIACGEFLFRARREKMRGNIGKRVSPVKDTISALKEAFDSLLNPLTGGADSKDVPAGRESEALFEQLQPLVQPPQRLLSPPQPLLSRPQPRLPQSPPRLPLLVRPLLLSQPLQLVRATLPAASAAG